MPYDPGVLSQRIVADLQEKGHIGSLGLNRLERGATGARYQIVCKPTEPKALSVTEVSYYFDRAGTRTPVAITISSPIGDEWKKEEYATDKYSPRIKVSKSVKKAKIGDTDGYRIIEVFIENGSKQIRAKGLTISEKLEGVQVATIRGAPRVWTENLIYEFDGANNINFKDHILLQEQHQIIKRDAETFTEFASKQGIPASVVEAFKFNYLLTPQREAFLHIRSIFERSNTGSPDKSVLISVRTAGGKTEAFLLFPLTLMARNPQPGLFMIIMYPTKALANDQAKRIFAYIAHLNRSLGGPMVTMGVYHGDTMKESDDVKTHPFKRCPFCKGKTALEQKKNRILLSCPKCGSFPSVFLTRSEIESSLPNILITNPDMMHLRLSNFWNHGFFGRPVTRCEECGLANFNPSRIVSEKTGRCSTCGGHVITVQSKPKFVVIDEVHLFRGSFGSHVGTLVSEMAQLVKHYTGAEPIVIGASATIDRVDATKIGQHLLGRDPVFIGGKEYYENASAQTDVKRHHLFIMPQGEYWRYTVYAITMVIDKYRKDIGEKVPTLVFANTIKDANNLEKAIAESTEMYTRAHTAELSKQTRQQIEEEFSRGDVDVLAATKTLEVGVDFDNIRVLILVGAPFSYNDFIQRIGRAGRGQEIALVITVLRPFIPLDAYYFENCRDLLNPDSGLLEAFPIQRNNPFIVRKHGKDSLLTCIFAKDRSGASTYYGNLRRDTIGVAAKFSEDNLRDWMLKVFVSDWTPPPDADEIKQTISGEIAAFLEHLKNRQPRDANETVVKHFERDLRFSIRTNDDEVSIISNTDPEKILRLTADRFILPVEPNDEEAVRKEADADVAEAEEPDLRSSE